MDREELLRNLDITGEELQDFLRKFANFQRELTQAQLKMLLRSLPSMEQASQTLGTTAGDLTQLLREEVDQLKNTVICGFEGIDDINQKK